MRLFRLIREKCKQKDIYFVKVPKKFFINSTGPVTADLKKMKKREFIKSNNYLTLPK